MEFHGTSVGLDVHARSVAAFAFNAVTGEVWRGSPGPSTAAVVAWTRDLPGQVRVAYEAGPSGFVLARAFQAAGIECTVAAPSKMLRPAGDHVKTDKRDAMLLARLLRVGELVAVRVPTEAEEHARDLVRAREDARADLMRARHRLSKLLLRYGHVFEGKTTWTHAHDRWMLDTVAGWDSRRRAAFDASYEQVAFARARRDRLEKHVVTDLATDPLFADTARRLGCLRGIAEFTAVALTIEIGDWHRFTGASIGAFVGLVPSEASSGASRRQGGITRAGNSLARRLLVEAAWHHRKDYSRPSKALQARWDKAPAPITVRAHQGNQRLHTRWQRFDRRQKTANIADVAIARELAGWCWELATMPA